MKKTLAITLSTVALVALSAVLPLSATAQSTTPHAPQTQSVAVSPIMHATSPRDSFTVTVAPSSKRPPHSVTPTNTRRPYEGSLKLNNTRAFLNGYVVTVTN